MSVRPEPLPADDSPGVSRWGLRRLHGRLLWSMVLVLVLALSALGLRTAADTSRHLHEEAGARARALARSVALAIISPILTQQLDQVEEAMLRMALLPDLHELRVVDPTGQPTHTVVTHPDRDPEVRFDDRRVQTVPGPGAPLDQQVLLPDGRRALVAWHPVGEPRPVAWVQVVQSLDQLEALEREVATNTAAAGLVAALLGSATLMWLLRGPLSGIRAAGRFALQLRQVDGTQLSLPRSAPLEAHSLVESLNITSTRLAQRARDVETAMAEVRRSRDALDQRNRELDAILSLSPSGLLALDTDGLVCFASAAIGRYTGLDPQGFVGRSLPWLEQRLREHCGVPDDWAGFEDAFTPQAAGHAGTALLVLQQPQRRELRLERSRVDTLGIGWLISAQDITHEREVERLKSEFLSTAAHELRTPMVSIHGFTELLLRRDPPPEPRRQMLETVHRNAVLMNHIINELLDLARIEARRGLDFERRELDLVPLLVQGVADFRPPDGREPPQLLGAGAQALPTQGDPGKLRQVLMNLLSNAYKYSSAPGLVRVECLLRPGDGTRGEVGLSVSDQGIGMTPEQLSRVFERFYRADPSGTVLGTGLGMAIVQEIVQLHGGHIELDSHPGQGTTVTVWLPRKPAAALDAA